MARQQIEEAARSQRSLQGESTIADRVDEWTHDRQLGTGWLKLLIVVGFCGFIALGYVLYQKQMHIRALYRKLADARTVLVSVGDERILKGQLEDRLWERHAHRDLLLETLLVLLREASENISIGSSQYRTLKDIEREKKVLTLAEEADFLEEKILVSKVTLEQKKALYEKKKDELALYELSVLHFDSTENAERFVEEFLSGMTLEVAAEKYSVSPRPLELDPIMAGDLESALGVFHGRPVRTLERGRFSGPLPMSDGRFAVYRLLHLDTDFDLVLPAVNTVFARRSREEFRRALVEKATIVSDQIKPEELVELKL